MKYVEIMQLKQTLTGSNARETDGGKFATSSSLLYQLAIEAGDTQAKSEALKTKTLGLIIQNPSRQQLY